MKHAQIILDQAILLCRVEAQKHVPWRGGVVLVVLSGLQVRMFAE
jgi:hypothetical protein